MVSLAIPLLFVGGMSWLAYRHVHQTHLNEALIRAIQAQDTAGALRLLDRGADPNAREQKASNRRTWQDLLDLWLGRRSRPDDQGPSALWYAIRKHDSTVVRSLLTRGAKGVNDKDAWGIPLIIRAQQAGLHDEAKGSDILHTLVEYGADVNAMDKSGGTALILAVFESWTDQLQFLIAHKANVNQADSGGVTPLMMAVDTEKNREIVKLLLAHGANVNARTTDGQTALTIARSEKRLAIIRLLQQAGEKE